MKTYPHFANLAIAVLFLFNSSSASAFLVQCFFLNDALGRGGPGDTPGSIITWTPPPDCKSTGVIDEKYPGQGIHEEITETALGETKFHVTLSTGNVIQFSQEALAGIVKTNWLSDSKFFSDLAHHFDEEKFNDAQNLLVEEFKSIVEGLPSSQDGSIQRETLGRALHTVQDFYAHSTWVEKDLEANQGAKKKLPHFGSNILTFLAASPSADTCNAPGEISGAPLTSGFWLLNIDSILQGSINWNIGIGKKGIFTKVSKCLHGSNKKCNTSDLTNCQSGPDLLGAGINKDAPKRKYFKEAHDLAVAATAQYVNDIIDAIGTKDETPKCKLLGVPVEQCTAPDQLCYDKLMQVKSQLYNQVIGCSSTTITVTKTGLGAGAVTSTPAGINCGDGSQNVCQYSFSSSAVTLTSSPDAGSVFLGWSGTGAGSCSGTTSTSCTKNMDGTNKEITATFGRPITGQWRVSKFQGTPLLPPPSLAACPPSTYCLQSDIAIFGPSSPCSTNPSNLCGDFSDTADYQCPLCYPNPTSESLSLFTYLPRPSAGAETDTYEYNPFSGAIVFYTNVTNPTTGGVTGIQIYGYGGFINGDLTLFNATGTYFTWSATLIK